MARPRRLTTKIAGILIEARQEGASLKAAAKAAGVGQRTLMRWLSAGRAGENSQYAALREAMLQAERFAAHQRYLEWLGRRALRRRRCW